MFYKKIRKFMVVAIVTTFASISVFAQGVAEGKLIAKTVKTETGEIVTYEDKAGTIFKKVTVTVKGNVTLTETLIYDADGKIISKTTVAELKSDEENPKLLRREVYIENADGSKITVVTDIVTDGNGVTTTKTSSSTSNSDGSSSSTDSVTTTNPDGSSSTTTTVTTTDTDGNTSTTTTESGDGNQGGEAEINLHDPAGVKDKSAVVEPSEGDDAGSYTPGNSYSNTPSN
jgi:hypothetical protein